MSFPVIRAVSDQDLSTDNTVWLPSADIKIGSQDAVKKVLEQKSENTQTSRGKF